MTKKELTLSTAQLHESRSFSLLERLETTAWVVRLSRIYSDLLEEKVSARRTLKLVHAQVAAGTLLLLGGLSTMAAILLCVWTLLAVWQCKA